MLPVVALMVFGLIQVGLLVNAVTSLNHTVQEAARCSAVNATRCGTSQQTLDFARARFSGALIAPQFTVSDELCGRVVSATAAFDFNLAVRAIAVPLSARACYPAAG